MFLSHINVSLSLPFSLSKINKHVLGGGNKSKKKKKKKEGLLSYGPSGLSSVLWLADAGQGGGSG